MLRVRNAGGFGGYEGGLARFVADNKLQSRHFVNAAADYNVLYIDGKYDKVVKHQKADFAYNLASIAYESGAKDVAVLTAMTTHRGTVRRAIIGDYQDIIRFLGSRHMLSPRHVPVFYTHWLGGYMPSNTPVKCFLDIEWYGDDTAADARDSLADIIRLVQAELEDNGPLPEYSVIGGQRDAPPRGNKWSFHVTFHDYVFLNMSQHRDFVARVLQDKPMYDNTVYKKGGLMRIPWTPKDSSANTAAILRPVEFTDTGLKFLDDGFNGDFFENMDIIPRKPLNEYRVVQVASGRVRPRVITENSAPPVFSDRIEDFNERDETMLAFWSKLHTFLITKIQKHRHTMMTKFARGNRNVGVPTVSSSFSEFTRTARPGVYQVKVRGDTFCEYDAPNYCHSTGDNKITLSINFIRGSYNQLCFACNPRNAQIRYYSMFDGLGINITRQNHEASRTLQTNAKYGAMLLLHTIADDIIYTPKFGSIPYMFDSSVKIWKTNTEGTNILMAHKNDFREKYQRYIREAEVDRSRALIANAKNPDRARDAFIRFCQTDPFSVTTAATVVEAVISNYLCLGKRSPPSMDIHPHLVPLADDTCFNVITGENVTRTQDMFCTSYVNAKLKQSEDDECAQIRQWFLEVARGRPDLALYLMRLSGYFFTMETFDRHFYTNSGIGRNGKSVWSKLLKVTKNISKIHPTDTFSKHFLETFTFPWKSWNFND